MSNKRVLSDLIQRIAAERSRMNVVNTSFVCSYCGAAPEAMKEPRRYEYCIRKKCEHIICASCAADAQRGHREVRKYHRDSDQLLEYTKYGPICKEHAAPVVVSKEVAQ